MIALLAAIATSVSAMQTIAAPPLVLPTDPAATIVAARRQLVAHFDAIDKRTHMALAFETRLDEDIAQILGGSTPPLWTDAEFADNNRYTAALDASIVAQLSSGAIHAPGAVRGADISFITSPADGTLQPFGIYVPPTYDQAKKNPLVVFLHGRTNTEVDIISAPWLRQLADETGAILVAPYARGDIQYEAPAPVDVYATADVVRNALSVDGRRIYLAGHSMGGFGVFEVGPVHAEVWAGVMCVSGSITSADRNDVLRTFQNKPVYVVSGRNDPVIPNIYSPMTVQTLRMSGIPAAYYEEPTGLHSMKSVLPQLRAAWFDMLRGVRGSTSGLQIPLHAGGGQLPPTPN